MINSIKVTRDNTDLACIIGSLSIFMLVTREQQL